MNETVEFPASRQAVPNEGCAGYFGYPFYNQKRNRIEETFSSLAECGDDKEKERVEAPKPSFLEWISEVASTGCSDGFEGLQNSIPFTNVSPRSLRNLLWVTSKQFQILNRLDKALRYR